MLAYCKYHGIGVIPWSPLAVGKLARPAGVDTARSRLYSSIGMAKEDPVDAEIIKRVEEISKKREWKMSQVRPLRSARQLNF